MTDLTNKKRSKRTIKESACLGTISREAARKAAEVKIVEVPDEQHMYGMVTRTGDLIILYGDNHHPVRLPVEWLPALRKHLNEGMVEKLAIHPSYGTDRYEIVSVEQAAVLDGEEFVSIVRILVPAEQRE